MPCSGRRTTRSPFKHFKEGDLALFLPTRNQTSGAWAAFNIGFPHYFLREQEGHRLRNREWLVARISRIQEKVVDLSKSLNGPAAGAGGGGGGGGGGGEEGESLNDEENDNPFDLSDGLRWYMIDALEDKPGAPSTPGPGQEHRGGQQRRGGWQTCTRTRGRPRAKASAWGGRPSGIDGVSRTLSKSLERPAVEHEL